MLPAATRSDAATLTFRNVSAAPATRCPQPWLLFRNQKTTASHMHAAPPVGHRNRKAAHKAALFGKASGAA
jgi:hypothetical protein